MDRIFLRELRTETIIGIYDWERETRQVVSIDLEMPVDIRRAAVVGASERGPGYTLLCNLGAHGGDESGDVAQQFLFLIRFAEKMIHANVTGVVDMFIRGA